MTRVPNKEAAVAKCKDTSDGEVDGEVTVWTRAETALRGGAIGAATPKKKSGGEDSSESGDDDIEAIIEKGTARLAVFGKNNGDGEGSDGDDDSTYDDESERSECRDDDKNNVVVSDSLTGSGDGKELGSLASAKVADMLFYDVMKDVGVECFATLEDAIPCIEEYKNRSGIHLRVER